MRRKPLPIPMLTVGTLLVGGLLALALGVRWASDTGSAQPASMTCRVSASCSGDEVAVFRMSDTSNAHAGTPGGSTYGNVICCDGVMGLGTDCSGVFATVLTLSETDNAHVASDGSYGTQVCLSGGDDATAGCNYTTACAVGEVCLATISGATNAHVADCDGVDDYATKVCCLATPDNCPGVSNPGQEDSDSDGVGDACDLCTTDPNNDADNDGICAGTGYLPPKTGENDNCPDIANPDQQDVEQPPDGLGDVCDPDTQDYSAVSGLDGSVSVGTPDGTITFDGTTAVPESTVTIQEDAAGVGTIIMTAKGNKGKVSKKFDIISSSLLSGTVTAVIDFDPAIDEAELDNMRVTKKVTGPDDEIAYTLDSSVCAAGLCTQATISFELVDDATFNALLPLDSDDDGVYDQFDINDDADFEDAGELDNCPTTPNPGQENADSDQWGDACDNCPAVSTPWQVPVGDGDCDAFTDADEGVIGTDAADACPDDPADDAWPCDFDMNTVINITDLFNVLPPHFGSSPGSPDTNGDTIPDWSVRRDLAPNGVINITDVFKVLPPFYGSSCTP